MISQQLPAGWVWQKIGDVCKTTSGGTPSRRQPEYFQGAIPWVKSGELPDDLVTEVEEYITEEAVHNSSAKIFPKGTLLMAMYGATVGKLGILEVDAATNQAVCAIFQPDYIERNFLFWYLKSIRGQLLEISFGGAQPNISQTVIKNTLFPVPYPDEPERSLAEQRRIVARIEALLAEVREMRKLHDEITADANKLMEVILREVFPHSPYDVQPGWSWVQLSALGKVAGGGTPRKSEKSYWDGTIPWVSPKDMKADVIVDSQDHVTEEGIENSSAKLIPSKSVLIVFRSGILAHSLPVAIANRELTINQDMKAITPHADFVAEYIAYAMKAREKHFVTTCVKKGPTVHSIVGDRFWQEKVPVPEGADAVIKQQQIVSYLDAIREEVDEVCSLSDSDARLFDSLEQAILSQAFQGEL